MPLTQNKPERIVHEINWQVIIVQAIVQLIVLGSVAVGYVIVNEKWKGGVDAVLTNLNEVNKAQMVTNQRLADAIAKLSETVNILSLNQQHVVTLMDYHMKDDATRFQGLRPKK